MLVEQMKMHALLLLRLVCLSFFISFFVSCRMHWAYPSGVFFYEKKIECSYSLEEFYKKLSDQYSVSELTKGPLKQFAQSENEYEFLAYQVPLVRESKSNIIMVLTPREEGGCTIKIMRIQYGDYKGRYGKLKREISKSLDDWLVVQIGEK